MSIQPRPDRDRHCRTGRVLRNVWRERKRRVMVRRLSVLVLLTWLAAGIGPASAQTLPNLTGGPGCLGVPAETCVAWLKATMRLDEGFISAAMARRRQVDVHGKPLRRN